MTVIDVHAHVFPRVSREEARVLAGAGEPWLRENGDGTGMMMSGDAEYRPVGAGLWDPEIRVAAMDAAGVDVQAVSSTPLMFGYEAEPARAAEWCELVNQRILDHCAQAPGRLLPLCQVPLQDVESACEIVSKAAATGHRGVHIGNHVGPRYPDDADIVEFLAHCAREGMPVLMHPWDMLGGDRMAGRYMLPWLVGMAAETQLSILSLILSGAFERIPESLRMCFCHGGGSFAYLLGRADNAWHNRDIVREDSPRPPSAYTDRFFVDSAVFDPRALRLLVEVMGAERVMLGTDYPFPLGELEPGSTVRACEPLTEDDRDAILGGNAHRFFGLDGTA
ncbi:amidohydrolase family protein [Actinoallomurus iriomotensis]|uniref:2-amino-3-carboxymuconate-6-semialdehyde decarboxylase n=1 Tax=Actinoallomurus iriomotensis TaxID=478107 RepID=A0A9W6RDB1_9ACTN|nr:amidohydrolase family protein [Actinoallomurus iriomotensis]GLY73744.1 2-hydroxy-3-carboxy-6-oxo-7-methylocta-2,4-dienoate decarboxylase [Actinoallomurus iriomotensis]